MSGEINVLTGPEKQKAMEYFGHAVIMAKISTCKRSKCGSVIVNDGNIIGDGFNSPPSNDLYKSRCYYDKDIYHKKVTDKTCCVPAEQRAIMDALAKNPTKIRGSWLYFARLDNDQYLSFSGDPYCTICSKMALDVGISRFVLYTKEGVKAFETSEYNYISYQYGQ